MKICDPTGARPRADVSEALRLKGGLAGKTVGVLSNLWPSYEAMLERFNEQLMNKHKVARIVRYEIPRTRAAPDDLMDKVVAECDVAVVGLGN